MSSSQGYKVTILGAAATGKTSLATRACEGTFTEESVSTVGVEYMKKTVSMKGRQVVLMCWDTAGQERFRSVTRTLFTGARGIFLVYDITRKKSFEEVPSWLNDVRDRVPKDTPLFLVGNKSDLESQREVTAEEGDRYAKANGMLFIETSAKESHNVEKAFEWLAEKILDVETEREATAAAASAAEANGSGASAAAVRVNPQQQQQQGEGGEASSSGKVDLSKPKNSAGAAGGKSGCRC